LANPRPLIDYADRQEIHDDNRRHDRGAEHLASNGE
jgi:hypothetical protein